jgi:formate/nitrite transporter FocA (FNT family)
MTGIEKRGRSGTVVFVLMVIAGVIIALQYTPYARFAPERTSMLWGMLVGLIIGGFVFGWLRFKNDTAD